MKILGLTGSIGMGKSAVAAMFHRHGIPIFDADATVHELYRGPLVNAIEGAFPGTTAATGVDRAKLAKVLHDPQAMKRLEAIVHPAIAAERAAFLRRAETDGHDIVVMEVPLLFETGGDAMVDQIVVVSAPADIQRQRVMARPGMTPEKLDAILARQVPDAEKRARADVVIDTSTTLAETERAVDAYLARLRQGA